MPVYNYKCDNCEIEISVMHSMNEKLDFCTNCQEFDTMIKLLTTPMFNTKQKHDNSVGNVTKEYIEKNRDLLEQEKEKAKRETYEPT